MGISARMVIDAMLSDGFLKGHEIEWPHRDGMFNICRSQVVVDIAGRRLPHRQVTK